MNYTVGLKPKASKDLRRMQKQDATRLEKDGKKAFAVLPYEEFQNLQEELDEYEDLKDLRSAKAKEANAPVASLRSVRSALKI